MSKYEISSSYIIVSQWLRFELYTKLLFIFLNYLKLSTEL